jgi:hypothetical protein
MIWKHSDRNRSQQVGFGWKNNQSGLSEGDLSIKAADAVRVCK